MATTNTPVRRGPHPDRADIDAARTRLATTVPPTGDLAAYSYANAYVLGVVEARVEFLLDAHTRCRTSGCRICEHLRCIAHARPHTERTTSHDPDTTPPRPRRVHHPGPDHARGRRNGRRRIVHPRPRLDHAQLTCRNSGTGSAGPTCHGRRTSSPSPPGLEARRRTRHFGHPGTYPIALIIGAVALSLTGQFAEPPPHRPDDSSPPSPPWASSPWSSSSCPAPRPRFSSRNPHRHPVSTLTVRRRLRRSSRPSSSTPSPTTCSPPPGSRSPTTSRTTPPLDHPGRSRRPALRAGDHRSHPAAPPHHHRHPGPHQRPRPHRWWCAVTTYIIDVHHNLHTCPADPVPHPVDTRRTLIAITPGGPCHTPVTYRLNGIAYTTPCKNLRSSDRQCPACRITIWVRTVTTSDLGAIERNPNAQPAPPDTTRSRARSATPRSPGSSASTYSAAPTPPAAATTVPSSPPGTHDRLDSEHHPRTVHHRFGGGAHRPDTHPVQPCLVRPRPPPTP